MRPKLVTRIAALACCALLTTTPADVEVVPPEGEPFHLPAGMQPDFAGQIASDFSFRVSSLSGSSGSVDLSVAFRSTGTSGEIVIATVFTGPTSFVAPRQDVFTTSFEPTAACPHSGSCDAMFVAGWHARSRRAVIERWTVKGLAVGQASGLAGAGPAPTPSPLTFDRRKIWSRAGGDARPLEALGFDVVGSKLYFIEYGPEGRLLSLDLSSEEIGDLEWVADDSSLPGLSRMESISTGYHTEVGTVFMLRRHRAWEVSMPTSVRLFRDTDGDMQPDFGVLETLTIQEYRALLPQSGWQEHW